MSPLIHSLKRPGFMETLPVYHDKALTIIELEERFETTVAALDSDRCTITVNA